MIYSAIAPYYNLLMKHVNYKDWLYLIQKVIQRNFTSKQISIFEIGAGTGSLGKLLIKSGYNYHASDLSFEMSKIGKKEAHSFLCADARNLPIKKQFNMVLFLYDGINYLKSLSDYKHVFGSVASIIMKDGLFLFDITTEFNSIKYFDNYLNYNEFLNTSIFRHSYYIHRKQLQCNDFTIFSPLDSNSSLYSKKTENHVQKLFNPIQIKQVIPNNLFTCLGIWDGFSQKEYNSQSERIHFLLKRI
jgi:SAM-dependent methyltransferase